MAKVSIRLLSLLGVVALGASPVRAQAPAADPAPLTAAELAADDADWRALEPGLELRAFAAPQPATHGDGLIVVLRIDPAAFEFVLLASHVEGVEDMTASEWAAREDLVAAINAGMFEAAPAHRPVGFTRINGVDLNPRLSADNTLAAFGARDAGEPGFRLIDRGCDDLDALRPAYDNLLQSIRMISCNGANVWSQQDRRWSTAALAVDEQGRALFVHVRSPYSVHDLIDMLQALPLDIDRAMYLEGGPEATLYARANGVELERFGSYETGFYESDGNDRAWPLPNVIGVRRR